ncbi:DNA translocase FtsK [Erythrobacter sp. Alg231-14]|uniref:DNA translocase FtsK n=1 Tax=Erythrobacter sp. Alg231-14 TaxID=1922225 RepID=UPI000D55E766
MSKINPDNSKPLTEAVLYRRACEWVTRDQSASIAALQLHFRIGYRLASRLLNRMIDNGVLSVPHSHLH